MKRILTHPCTILLGLIVLCYGIYIPTWGLYGDDWPHLWVFHSFGTQGFVDLVAWDRPYSAWIYQLIAPFFGETVWAYHLFLLFLRWVCAVATWGIFRQIWPQQPQWALWIGILSAVYPGFKSQALPLEFILHFTVLSLVLISIWSNLLALRHPRAVWWLMGVSVIGALAHFSSEYHFGLELVRPLLIWIVIRQIEPSLSRQIRRALTFWLPNLLVFLAFFVWRTFIFSFPSYKPTFLTGLKENPLTALYDLALRVIADLRSVALGAWVENLTFPGEKTSALIFISLVIISAIGLFILLKRQDTHPADSNPIATEGFIPHPLLLGGFILLVSGIPFWVTGLPVLLQFPWDRSTIAFLMGVSVFVVGLIQLLERQFRLPLLVFLAAFSIGAHYMNAQNYQDARRRIADFYWQLTWRAPNLKPGTILLTDLLPLSYISDNNLAAVLNWTYAPNLASTKNAYSQIDLSAREDYSVFPGIEKGLTFTKKYRFLEFSGNTSDILIVTYQPPGCLQVIAPDTQDVPGMTGQLRQYQPLSNLGQIQTSSQPARPPELMGKEAAHEWCYYYEKADLARQQGDWAGITRLGTQALDFLSAEREPSEIAVFIEGYAHEKNWEMAKNLTQTAAAEKEHWPALCTLWQSLESLAETQNERNQIEAIKGDIRCFP